MNAWQLTDGYAKRSHSSANVVGASAPISSGTKACETPSAPSDESWRFVRFVTCQPVGVRSTTVLVSHAVAPVPVDRLIVPLKHHLVPFSSIIARRRSGRWTYPERRHLKSDYSVAKSLKTSNQPRSPPAPMGLYPIAGLGWQFHARTSVRKSGSVTSALRHACGNSQ